MYLLFRFLKESNEPMKEIKHGFNPHYEESPSIELLSTINGYAVLEFGTNWCGHCKAASSIVEAALKGKNLPHIKVEDGKGKRLGRHFKVKLWPTLILLDSGEEIARIVRPKSVTEIQEAFSPF